MKLITILLTTGLLFAASGQNKSSDPTKAAIRKGPPTPASPTIPKDATPLPDGSYRYVDKSGKKLIYRQTPFGVSKAEEHPVAQATQRIEDDPAKSEDQGESVRFSRPTPFGPKVWTKKKSELDSYEKSIWERDQQKNGSPAKTSDAAKQD